MELLTEQNARKIGSVLGELVSVEDPMNNRGVGRSFLRIRVKVDVEKPLVGGFWVPRENKEKVWAEVKYEKIADFCFGCGRLGHMVRFCENKGEMGEEIEGRRRYGLWMKAAPIKGREEGRWKREKDKDTKKWEEGMVGRGIGKEDGNGIDGMGERGMFGKKEVGKSETRRKEVGKEINMMGRQGSRENGSKYWEEESNEKKEKGVGGGCELEKEYRYEEEEDERMVRNIKEGEIEGETRLEEKMMGIKMVDKEGMGKENERNEEDREKGNAKKKNGWGQKDVGSNMGGERGVLEVITNWEREVREEIQRTRWRMESPVRKNGQDKRVPYIMELPPEEEVEGSGYELIENKEGVGVRKKREK